MYRLTVLVVCTCIVVGVCSDDVTSADDIAMITNSSKNLPRINYMRDLQLTLATPDGRPIHKDLSVDPTSVLCLADYDIVNDSVRTDPTTESKCSLLHSFVFEWDSDNYANRQLLLERSYVRIFLESWNNHIYFGKNVSVNVSAAVQLINKRTYNGTQNMTQNKTTWDLVRIIEVQHGFQAFLEVDIRDQLATVWESDRAESLINVQLKFDVDCNDVKHDRVPLKLANPATLGLTEPKRKRKLALQPFLMIFADDVDIRRQIARAYPQGDSVLIGEKGRRKRSIDTNTCKVENFTVHFPSLELTNVIFPPRANIRQCVGGCSLYNIQDGVALATNHARILSGIASIHGEEEPCCSAFKYSPIYLTVVTGQGFTVETSLYPEFVVEECGCR